MQKKWVRAGVWACVVFCCVYILANIIYSAAFAYWYANWLRTPPYPWPDEQIRIDYPPLWPSPTAYRHNISDFSDIEYGSTQDEVEQIVGKPHTWMGSGNVRYIYLLKEKKCCIILMYLGGKLENISIYDADGNNYSRWSEEYKQTLRDSMEQEE